jgi:hypothetical protein
MVHSVAFFPRSVCSILDTLETQIRPSPLPPGGSAVCIGPDFRKRKKSRNQIASPNWNRMQRCGIGGEGETGAFKCLTPST